MSKKLVMTFDYEDLIILSLILDRRLSEIQQRMASSQEDWLIEECKTEITRITSMMIVIQEYRIDVL